MYVCCFFCGCETCETQVPSFALFRSRKTFFFFCLFFTRFRTFKMGIYDIYDGGKVSLCANRHKSLSLSRAFSLSLSFCVLRVVVNFRTHHREEEEEEERIPLRIMGVLRRARKSNPSKGTEGGKSAPQQHSRIEERLRTARILAEEDDDDDDELLGRSKRTKAQIERDLSDPRVHKRIVENLYGAYKTRVRSSFDLSFRSRVVLNRVFLSAFYRKKRDGKRRRTRSQTLRLLRDTTTTTKCRPREGEKDRSKEDEETPRWSG